MVPACFMYSESLCLFSVFTIWTPSPELRPSGLTIIGFPLLRAFIASVSSKSCKEVTHAAEVNSYINSPVHEDIQVYSLDVSVKSKLYKEPVYSQELKHFYVFSLL